MWQPVSTSVRVVQQQGTSAGVRAAQQCLPNRPRNQPQPTNRQPQPTPQVASALGQDLAMPAASNMMRYAAERVLGWGSGAGRTNGAEITADEFAALVDHFRVAD